MHRVTTSWILLLVVVVTLPLHHYYVSGFAAVCYMCNKEGRRRYHRRHHRINNHHRINDRNQHGGIVVVVRGDHYGSVELKKGSSSSLSSSSSSTNSEVGDGDGDDDDGIDDPKQDHQNKLLLLQNLKFDFDTLTKLRPPIPSADPSIPAAIVSAGSSYTRIWTHSTWNIHSNDPPHKRYLRHILRWHKSTTARKIFPTVLLAGGWSILVVSSLLLTKHFSGVGVGSNNASMALLRLVTATTPAFAFLSAPLALLLTLRTNASLARLLEARQAWGKLVLHTRTLASILHTYLFPINPKSTVLAIRYLSIIGWLLKAQVRGEKDSDTLQVIQTMLHPTEECQWLSSQPKPTVAVTARVRHICAHAMLVPSTTTATEEASNNSSRSSSSMASMLASTQLLIIEEEIKNIETANGVCERLFGSPTPPTYTRHLSRVMSMWLFLLPISLIMATTTTATTTTTAAVATVVSTAPMLLGVTCATMVAAYVFVGLDEVGMEIENVFRLLPLQQLAGAIQNDVQNQFLCTMPSMPELTKKEET